MELISFLFFNKKFLSEIFLFYLYLNMNFYTDEIFYFHDNM